MKDNGTQFYKLKEREERNDSFPFYASNTWPRGFHWKSLSSVNGLVIIKLWCSLSCLIRRYKMDSFLLGTHTWHRSTYKSSYANELCLLPFSNRACILIHYKIYIKSKWSNGKPCQAIRGLVISDSIILTTSLLHSRTTMSKQPCCAFIISSVLKAMAKCLQELYWPWQYYFKFIHSKCRCPMLLQEHWFKKTQQFQTPYWR